MPHPANVNNYVLIFLPRFHSFTLNLLETLIAINYECKTSIFIYFIMVTLFLCFLLFYYSLAFYKDQSNGLKDVLLGVDENTAVRRRQTYLYLDNLLH